MTTDPAEGFTALFRSSPFLDRTGPFYSKGNGQSLSIGLRVLDHLSADFAGSAKAKAGTGSAVAQAQNNDEALRGRFFTDVFV